jgi:glycine cleavage system aminomethyltransferase T
VTSAADSEVVGEIRSATLGPSSEKPAAIAMIKYAHSKGGTALVVDGRAAVVRG